jgi:hypothetical protein
MSGACCFPGHYVLWFPSEPPDNSNFSSGITAFFHLHYLQFGHYCLLPPTLSSVRALRPSSTYTIFSSGITAFFHLHYLQFGHYGLLPPTLSSVRALRPSSTCTIFSSGITTSFHVYSHQSLSYSQLILH